MNVGKEFDDSFSYLVLTSFPMWKGGVIVLKPCKKEKECVLYVCDRSTGEWRPETYPRQRENYGVQEKALKNERLPRKDKLHLYCI